MRRLLIASVFILGAPCSYAQTFNHQQTYPAPTEYQPQQQVSDNSYAGQPVYVPQDYAPPPQHQAPVQPRIVAPSDYGQSVMTDIRQMNF